MGLSRSVWWKITGTGAALFAAPVAAEFFIELVKEGGWYERPGEKVAGGMMALSTLTGSWWFAVGLGLFFGGLAMLTIDLPKRAEARREPTGQRAAPEPNYAVWDQVRSFDLGAAAYLWAERVEGVVAGMDPAAAMPVDVLPWHRMLKDAVVSGDLVAQLHGTGVVDYWARLDRSDLVAFAEKRNLRPKFLFPAVR